MYMNQLNTNNTETRYSTRNIITKQKRKEKINVGEKKLASSKYLSLTDKTRLTRYLLYLWGQRDGEETFYMATKTNF